MKRIIPILIIMLVSIIGAYSQTTKPSLAIIEIKSVGLDRSNEEITDIVRFEIERSQKYLLMDKDDMQYRMAKAKLEADNCFNPICIVFTGKTILADKVLTGSVSKLGDNKLVVLKLYDMKTEQVEISKKIEVIADEDESINEIIKKSIEEFYTSGESFTTIDISTKKVEPKLEPVHEPVVNQETNTQVVKNANNTEDNYNSFFEEPERKKESRFPKLVIFTRPTTLLEQYSKVSIGTQYSFDDITALKLYYAYLFETNNGQINTINGSEPGAYSGYELRSEFLFRVPQDYFDYENIYSRIYFSMELAYQKKFLKEMMVNTYDENLQTGINYSVGGSNSRVVMGNIKMGIQNVFSNRVYLDPYIGLGVRTYKYSFNNNNNLYFNNNLRNRTLPNFVFGFDFGFLIK